MVEVSVTTKITKKMVEVEVPEKTFIISLNETQAHTLRTVLGQCAGNAFYAEDGISKLYYRLTHHFPNASVPGIKVECNSTVLITKRGE